MNGGTATARRARVNRLGAYYRYWYPLAALIRRETRKRYATTWLGGLWAFLQPLATVAIYLVVFGFVLRYGREATDAKHFALFMLAGLLPFMSIADGLQRACGSLREDRSLLEREGFPGEVVPAARVVSAAFPEAVGLVLLALAAAAWGSGASLLLAALPILLLLRLVITTGLAWLVSVLAVFVADTAEVLSFLLTAWLFLTPIFYAPDQLPDALAWTLAVNPLYHVVEAYRAILLDGRLPFSTNCSVLAWAVMLGGCGLWFFRKSIERAKDFL